MNRQIIKGLKHSTIDFERALLAIDRSGAERIISAFEKNDDRMQIISELVTNALENIGKYWEDGKVALSQVYMSGIICEELIDKLIPSFNINQNNNPVAAIAVFEDFHVLGKRIIYSTLRAGGFNIIDLGNGLNAEDIVKNVKEKNIKILLLSVLMLPSALKIKQLKELLTGIDVKVIVGGAPFRFDDKLWIEVGADATGEDPSETLKIITKLLGEIK